MNISLDGGALCANRKSRFGNYIFSLNLIQALESHDDSNRYTIYSFCDKPEELNLQGKAVYKRLTPREMWMRFRVSLEERVNKQDVFLAVNQALPTTSAEIIAFSHGLSFYYHKALYPDSYSVLMKQLQAMSERAKYIVVSSQKVKKELERILQNPVKIMVIPFGIPLDFLIYKKKMRKKYFLNVGMNHSIKNLEFLTKAFLEFKKDRRFSDYKLIQIEKSNFNRKKIKQLYQEAAGYLTSSLYESFNLPVLEALSQNCPVVGLRSAIIPEFDDFVNVADNMRNFVSIMKKTASKSSKKINQTKLRKEFNWKSYVKKLIQLY